MKNITFVLLFVVANCLSQTTTIYTIGDSTMANKPNPDENPERGWVQLLPSFFNKKVVIDNRAVNGRSSRSFITEGRWAILQTIQPEDYVFIQFGLVCESFRVPSYKVVFKK